MTDEKQKRRAIFINDSKTTSSQRPIEKVTVQRSGLLDQLLPTKFEF
jgi:hypothetical protein